MAGRYVLVHKSRIESPYKLDPSHGVTLVPEAAALDDITLDGDDSFCSDALDVEPKRKVSQDSAVFPVPERVP